MVVVRQSSRLEEKSFPVVWVYQALGRRLGAAGHQSSNLSAPGSILCKALCRLRPYSAQRITKLQYQLRVDTDVLHLAVISKPIGQSGAQEVGALCYRDVGMSVSIPYNKSSPSRSLVERRTIEPSQLC